MSDDNTYRVWVGCLACYNNGELVGQWFDAIDAPGNGQDFADAIGRQECAGFAEEPHEELWVMDFENSPIDREHSVSEARQYAEWISDVDPDDLEGFYLFVKEYLGGKMDEDSASTFEDHFIGYYDGGYWGDSFVAEGWADDSIQEQLETATSIVRQGTGYGYGAERSTEFVIGLLEQWQCHLNSAQIAWEAECNGEISALRMDDGRALVYRPYS